MKSRVDRLSELIHTLAPLAGPSGAEDIVIDAVRSHFHFLGLQSQVDALGNVIVTVPGTAPDARTVMMSAHMDEIGFVIRKIEKNGFLRISPIGGVHNLSLPGQRVMFLGSDGLVQGVVGLQARHLLAPGEQDKSLAVDEVYVDVLAPTDKDVRRLGLEVGTLGVFDAAVVRRGNFIQGKALDDRLGVCVLMHLAEILVANPPPCNVIFVASVQEEFNIRGVVPAARAIDPDMCLCVDIAIATDTPSGDNPSPVHLGEGPVVTGFSRGGTSGLIPNPRLRTGIVETAAIHDIAIQHAVLRGGLSEGAFIQYEARGIPTVDVGFGVRYTHTPIETAHLEDAAQLVRLLHAFVQNTAQGLDLTRGHS